MVGVDRLVRWKRLALSVASMAVVSSIGEERASASVTFPPILAEKLGMDCVPNCLPCHTGVVGTADNQRFDGIKGEIERVALNTVTSDEIFAAALDQVLEEKPSLDSDGDNIQDIDEIKAAADPYGSDTPLCERPLYGCFASQVAPTLPPRLGALALGLGVAASLLLRRRR